MKFIGQNEDREYPKIFIILLLFIFIVISVLDFFVLTKGTKLNKLNILYPDKKMAIEYSKILIEIEMGCSIDKNQLKCELINDYIWKVTDEKSAKTIYFKSTDGEIICLDED